MAKDIPKTVRQNEVQKLSRTKEKKLGVWDFRGKEFNLWEDEKE